MKADTVLSCCTFAYTSCMCHAFATHESHAFDVAGPQGLIAPGMIPMPGMPGMQNMQSMQGMPPWPVSFISSAPTGPVTRQRPNLLPHPSRHGVAIAAKKKKSKSHSRKVPQQDKTSGAPNHHDNKAQPGFLGDGKAMLVCRVSLGRLALGGSGLRRPPQGFDAVSGPGGTKFPQALHPSMQAIFAVYDNSQAYPEYIVHFRLHSSQ